MCCSSGVCGPDVDPLLPSFAGMLAKLEGMGVEVERYNLAQQPMAFAQNQGVRAILDAEGVEVLPLIFVDGVLEMKGCYPNSDQRASFLERSRAAKEQAS